MASRSKPLFTAPVRFTKAGKKNTTNTIMSKKCPNLAREDILTFHSMRALFLTLCKFEGYEILIFDATVPLLGYAA